VVEKSQIKAPKSKTLAKQALPKPINRTPNIAHSEQSTQTDLPKLTKNRNTTYTQTEPIKPVPRFNQRTPEPRENEIDNDQQMALQATYDLIMEKIKTQLYIGAPNVEKHLDILGPAIKGIFTNRLEKTFPNIKIRSYWETMTIHQTHPTHPHMLEVTPANQRVMAWLLQ
jgi:hypothetical protein